MELQLSSEKDNEIYFNGYIVNKDLYDILSNKDESERIETFNNVIMTGTIAIKSVSIKERTDYVKKELIDFLPRLKDDIDKAISEILNQKLESQEKILENQEKISEESRYQILQTITDKTSDLNYSINNIFRAEVINQIISDILNEKLENQEKISEESRSRIVQTITDKISDLYNINNILRTDVLNRMLSIEKSIDEQKTWKKAQYESTAKGKGFEKNLKNVLNDISLPIHDNIIDVSDIPGELARCKKGDFVVEIRNIPFKFIIEAKSIKEDSDISKSEIEDYMDESLKNRKNSVFIITVFEDDIPDKLKGINFIGTNKLICNLEGLQTAYYNARVYVQENYMRYKDQLAYKKTLDEKNKDRITEITKSQIKNQINILFKELKRIHNIRETNEQFRRNLIKTANDGVDKLDEELTYLYSTIKNRFIVIDNALESLNDQEETLNAQKQTISPEFGIEINEQKDYIKSDIDQEIIDEPVILDKNNVDEYTYSTFETEKTIEKTEMKKTRKFKLGPAQTGIDNW